jgi:hypothetical protein
VKICDGRQRAIARLLLLVAITTTSAACDSIRELSFTPVFRGNSAPGPVPRDGYGKPILTPQEKAKIPPRVLTLAQVPERVPQAET